MRKEVRFRCGDGESIFGITVKIKQNDRRIKKMKGEEKSFRWRHVASWRDSRVSSPCTLRSSLLPLVSSLGNYLEWILLAGEAEVAGMVVLISLCHAASRKYLVIIVGGSATRTLRRFIWAGIRGREAGASRSEEGRKRDR